VFFFFLAFVIIFYDFSLNAKSLEQRKEYIEDRRVGKE